MYGSHQRDIRLNSKETQADLKIVIGPTDWIESMTVTADVDDARRFRGQYLFDDQVGEEEMSNVIGGHGRRATSKRKDYGNLAKS